MNQRQLHALALRETDVGGALRRLGNQEALYTSCLSRFLSDQTIRDLNDSVRNQNWDDAFTAAHALKGVAGNMGFVPLMHATGQLVVVIRAGRTGEIGETLQQVNSSYRDIIDAIHSYLQYEDKQAGGESNE